MSIILCKAGGWCFIRAWKNGEHADNILHLTLSDPFHQKVNSIHFNNSDLDNFPNSESGALTLLLLEKYLSFSNVTVCILGKKIHVDTFKTAEEKKCHLIEEGE